MQELILMKFIYTSQYEYESLPYITLSLKLTSTFSPSVALMLPSHQKCCEYSQYFWCEGSIIVSTIIARIIER